MRLKTINFSFNWHNTQHTSIPLFFAASSNCQVLLSIKLFTNFYSKEISEIKINQPYHFLPNYSLTTYNFYSEMAIIFQLSISLRKSEKNENNASYEVHVADKTTFSRFKKPIQLMLLLIRTIIIVSTYLRNILISWFHSFNHRIRIRYGWLYFKYDCMRWLTTVLDYAYSL